MTTYLLSYTTTRDTIKPDTNIPRILSRGMLVFRVIFLFIS